MLIILVTRIATSHQTMITSVREPDSFGSRKVYSSLTIAVPRTARKSQEAGTRRWAISVIK